MELSYMIGGLVFLAIMLAIGIYAGIGEDRRDFLIGSRQYGALRLAASIGIGWITVLCN